jgi:acrylyl-CoA reductase (NADPH)
MAESKIPGSFPALVARERAGGDIRPEAGDCDADILRSEWSTHIAPVELQLDYSCLNYKDALSATGHKGISPNYPHIPGIDGFGRRLDTGEEVIITGFDFGMGTPGGFGRYTRVPEDWLIPRPPDLSLIDAAAYGTAGVTAALCIDALIHEGVKPESGPVLVTGATGGVGSIALSILSKLSYEVHALTGKADHADWLLGRGAAQVLARDAFDPKPDKPLLRPEYAGAVDTAGGAILHRILRSLKFDGAVAACGMVAGTDLPTSIFPFILRGTRLIGIASADSSRDKKARMWKKLAAEWNLPGLSAECHTSGLEELPGHIDAMLAGNISGRIIVDLREKR